MTVQLNRSYGGYPAGAIAVFDAPTEEALIAQGIAANSAAAPTTGTTTPATIMQGRAAAAIAAANVVVSHPLCTPQSVVLAVVAQAAADATALRVERVLPAAGQFTIYLTAGATAVTVLNWILFNVVGSERN